MRCFNVRGFGSALRGSEGNQLVELAVVLPLLMVLVVGIFDFGGAFNIKQKLNNTVREGARFGSSEPTGDLNSGGTPNSVLAIRNVVDNYLTAEELNDCNLARAFGANSGPLQWTFTANGNGCTGPLTLTVSRSFAVSSTVTGASNNINLISTQVSIVYPYAWQFGKVTGLIGGTFTTLPQITTDAMVTNAD